jgi:predicted ATP-dependent endonuclease of OLD family
MYITKIHIKNVRSLKNLTWEIDETECPGWHVIIGDNGSGKSTFLRAISLTFVFNEFEALRLNKNEWLNREADYGNIDLELVFDRSTDTFSGKGNTPNRKKLPVSLKVARHSNQKISIEANTRPVGKQKQGTEQISFFCPFQAASK